MRVVYYVYDLEDRASVPLAPGTALYALVRKPGEPDRHLIWQGDQWANSELLGSLLITGNPALDSIAEGNLPEFVDRITE